MSFHDYVQQGQTVDFEIELSGKRPKYLARVADISDEVLKISFIEKDYNKDDIGRETKGIIWGKKRGLQYSLYVEVQDVDYEHHEITLKHVPSRTHLRVDAFIKLDYKKISEEELQEKRKKYILNMAGDSEAYLIHQQRLLSEEFESQASIPPEIINEIHSINRKLDFIIKIIGRQDEENIFNKKPIEVNLSGSGIRFHSQDVFSEKDYLDMSIVLPVSSGIMIEMIGEVVRCAPLDNDEAVNDIAIKFVAINEDDRECIIRYVFKRQRELLRAEESEE